MKLKIYHRQWSFHLTLFPQIGFTIFSNLFWTVLPFNAVEKEDAIDNL